MCLLFAPTLLWGQSHPSWWTWASAEATALVGIQWDVLRASALGPPLEETLFGAKGYGLPDLACVRQARAFVLSSPPFTAVAYGDFKAATLSRQASAKGFRRRAMDEFDLWIAPTTSGVSLVRISDQVVVIAERSQLEALIDQTKSDVGRTYSLLLPKAALLAKQNLWIVSQKDADDLREVFGPVEQSANDPDLGPRPVSSPKPTPEPASSSVAINGKAAPVLPPPVPPAPVAQAPPQPIPAAPQAPPAQRKVIRIVGLDDGTREIEVKPANTPSATGSRPQ